MRDVAIGEGLTLPQMYVPEKRASASHRKMNEVIDKPESQLSIFIR
jgi:hypothetical protein